MINPIRKAPVDVQLNNLLSMAQFKENTLHQILIQIGQEPSPIRRRALFFRASERKVKERYNEIRFNKIILGLAPFMKDSPATINALSTIPVTELQTGYLAHSEPHRKKMRSLIVKVLQQKSILAEAVRRKKIELRKTKIIKLKKWTHILRNPDQAPIKIALILIAKNGEDSFCVHYPESRDQQFLLSISDQCHVILAKGINSVEEMAQVIEEVGTTMGKVSHFSLFCHGPGVEKQQNGKYFYESGLLLGEHNGYGPPDFEQEVRSTPILVLEDIKRCTLMVNVFNQYLAKGATIHWQACALKRIEPADENLVEYFASHIKAELHVTMYATSQNNSGLRWIFDRESPQKARFFASEVYHWQAFDQEFIFNEETTVVLHSRG